MERHEKGTVRRGKQNGININYKTITGENQERNKGKMIYGIKKKKQ